MLTVLAHDPATPSTLWSAWNLDPLVWLPLAAVAALYVRGMSTSARPSARRRRRLFAAGLGVLAVAIVSPLDALAAALASAHMVQHLLITVVAAPLLVASRPVPASIRGLPARLRRPIHGWRRTALAGKLAGLLDNVVGLAAVFTATLWVWHAAGPYDLAVRNDVAHAVEHMLFLATAVAVWAAIAARIRRPVFEPTPAIVALFALSVQGSVLGALLTFAREPWYEVYSATTAPWGLTPLADQRLAGVIMWVPGGAVYLATALLALGPAVRELALDRRETL